MDAAIQLKNVTVFQGRLPVLRQVDLTVQKGEFAYLVGRTGSGKSSLLKTLYGELPLEEGEGSVGDFILRDLKKGRIPFLRRHIGIVFQDFQLLTDRNALDNLLFVLKATGWKNRDEMLVRAREVLKKVGLETKDYKIPAELSGGEQQRLVIARAMLNNPEVILADEPTGNLDPDTTDEIMQLLFNICRDFQTAFIMATHDYGIIQKYPARVVRIEHGQVKEISAAGV
jgi:cell division transport system ATP-binding protein